MARVTKSLEVWNAREQLLSADLMRAQFLASRDDQDLQAAFARGFDSSTSLPTTPANLLSTLGTPISGIDVAPTIAASSGFTMNIGAGSGFLYDPGSAGLTADDSPYLVVRWLAAPLTFANPDATNARIDLVYATPAMVLTDSQSRIVLVDPTTRAVTAQNVFKTSNPQATLGVVTGTPAATPLPPAVPADSLALFYVCVPASVGSSSSFAPCRASWRRAPFPLNSMAGIISGMELFWDLAVDPAAASSSLSTSIGPHRLMVDGELMEFVAGIDSAHAGVVVDTANNPFGSPASATWHKPYYIYAVGGRHNPMPAYNSTSGQLSPVTLVESLTPPNVVAGIAAANLTVNGVTVTPAGTVYVGIGAVTNGTTRRLPCTMDGEFVNLTETSVLGVNALTRAAASANFEAFDGHAPPVVPLISTQAKVNLISGSTLSNGVFLAPDNGIGSAPAPGYGVGVTSICAAQTVTGPVQIPGTGVCPMNGLLPKFWVLTNAGAGTNALVLLGFDHKIRRLHF